MLTKLTPLEVGKKSVVIIVPSVALSGKLEVKLEIPVIFVVSLIILSFKSEIKSLVEDS